MRVAFFYYLCCMEKELLQQAQQLLDYLCENIYPYFTDTGDLDPIDDYEEIVRLLPNNERVWYDLWTLIYDELDCFIGENLG